MNQNLIMRDNITIEFNVCVQVIQQIPSLDYHALLALDDLRPYPDDLCFVSLTVAWLVMIALLSHQDSEKNYPLCLISTKGL